MEQPDNKVHVCFVCPYCYPLFNPEYRTMFGGWEVRISQTAKEVARRQNFRVSLIVADSGQPHRETREGVELIAWQGKSFWGISNRQNLDEEQPIPTNFAPDSGRPAQDENPYPKPERQKNPLSRIKRIYKKIVPWKLRIVIHGTLHGVIAGSKLAFAHARSALSIATHAIGNMADHPVFPNMVGILEEADADIYVVPGNSDISASTAWYCKTHQRVYIMLAGSNMDFNPDILEQPSSADAYGVSYSLLLYSIQNAARHIVQNQQQAEMAKAFGVSPILIPNPIDLETKYPKDPNPETILWVGNTDERVKQPSLMLEVVKSFPDLNFTMIVTPVIEEVYERIEKTAERLPNLKLLSRIPFEEVEEHFAHARIFVNTSTFEGFPNTFLQAGKYGVPILSLQVDPNGMISEHKCGLTCEGDANLLETKIEQLMTDLTLYQQLSANIYEYVCQNHDKDKIIPQYEAVFESVLKPTSSQLK